MSTGAIGRVHPNSNSGSRKVKCSTPSSIPSITVSSRPPVGHSQDFPRRTTMRCHERCHHMMLPDAHGGVHAIKHPVPIRRGVRRFESRWQPDCPMRSRFVSHSKATGPCACTSRHPIRAGRWSNRVGPTAAGPPRQPSANWRSPVPTRSVHLPTSEGWQVPSTGAASPPQLPTRRQRRTRAMRASPRARWPKQGATTRRPGASRRTAPRGSSTLIFANCHCCFCPVSSTLQLPP